MAAAAAPRALDAGIDIIADAAQACMADAAPFLLRELLANLIDNAILYAGRGSTATISVASKAASVVIRVTDDGVGLPEADRARAFGRFQRGANAPGYGSGLGLSIVAEIAALFGGDAHLLIPTEGDGGFGIEVVLPASGSS